MFFANWIKSRIGNKKDFAPKCEVFYFLIFFLMYVNLEITGRYNWWDDEYVVGWCIQVSEASKLTDIFFENTLINFIEPRLKKLYEKDGEDFSLPLQISNDRKKVKFSIMRGTRKIWWWIVDIIGWEEIYRL